jgi:hypothetical protein
MKYEELLDYEERERRYIRNTGYRAVKGGIIRDVEQMYGDLRLPKIRGVQRNSAPLGLLCFLYPTTLVYVPPMSRDALKNRFGLDIDSFVELARKGIVQPLIGHPTYYADAPHLDPILKLNPPSVWARGTTLLDVLGRDKFFEEARQRLPLKKIAHIGWARQKWARHYPTSTDDILTKQIEVEVSTLYADLCAFGYTDIAHEIAMEHDPDIAIKKLLIATEILVYPLLMGIRGTPNYGVKDPSLIVGLRDSALIERVKHRAQGIPEAHFLSQNVKLLLEGLRIEFPKTIDAEAVLSFHKEDLSKKLWMALNQLESEATSDHMDQEALLGKAETVERLIISEVSKAALSYALARDSTLKIVSPVFRVSAFAAGFFMAFKVTGNVELSFSFGALTLIGGLRKAEEWIVEKILTKRFSPIAAHLWWIEEWKRKRRTSRPGSPSPLSQQNPSHAVGTRHTPASQTL